MNSVQALSIVEVEQISGGHENGLPHIHLREVLIVGGAFIIGLMQLCAPRNKLKFTFAVGAVMAVVAGLFLACFS